ncbi:GIY-YIG nuclease family protein [Herbidospora daliensis]|uniref:GIY-YIG nuclease family protein n=1 Tax=Herbidospora daliensis TaxID=295585 RepID=UPI000783E51B|nr:GIY-YIG nuclease family protein [Herbidospora daliensis]
MTLPTSLYRLFAADGSLLYVGIGGNPGRRFEQHRSDKPWWGDVASMTIEHHPTREAALAAELQAIKTENPRHNIAGRIDDALPRWEHRPLSNGAYLDTEDRGDHFYVGINRDELVDRLHHCGQWWLTPSSILEATDFLNQVSIFWLWADGCQQETFTGIGNSRYRGVNVRRTHVEAAQRALTASEIKGDIAPINRLVERLQRTFPSIERIDDMLDRTELTGYLVEPGPEVKA